MLGLGLAGTVRSLSAAFETRQPSGFSAVLKSLESKPRNIAWLRWLRWLRDQRGFYRLVTDSDIGTMACDDFLNDKRPADVSTAMQRLQGFSDLAVCL